MVKPTILVLGNPLEERDKAAISLLPKLREKFPKINFLHFDPTEELPEEINKELVIIDTVDGINKVTKFDETNHWSRSPRMTLHDYDLPVELGILKKLGKIRRAVIIGVPANKTEEKIFKDLEKILQSLS